MLFLFVEADCESQTELKELDGRFISVLFARSLGHLGKQRGEGSARNNVRS